MATPSPVAGSHPHAASKSGDRSTPSTSPSRQRHVRFSPSVSCDSLTDHHHHDHHHHHHAASPDAQKKLASAVPSTAPGSTAARRALHALAGGRRLSMFGRTALAAMQSQVTVTCIPAIVRFRRAARIIRLLCMVCIACKKSLTYSVSQNSWVALKEALLRESDVSHKEQDKDKPKGSGIVTDDPELTFDLNKFRRASKDHDEMPLKIKELLRKNPKSRSADENANIQRSMQKLEIFARYTNDVQKRLCAKAWIEEFDANRVILREGHMATGFYFVISGRLVANEEEANGSMVTTLLKRGDKFGEDEMAGSDKRTATVMSQDDIVLFVVHKEEYQEIFLAKNNKDVGSLEICKKNPVFNHWPIQKLIENPGSWNMQNYRPGTLIVEDSSRCEWVYIIKSGQCKVVKCLKPREPEDDPAQTRKLMAKRAREKLLKEIQNNNVQSPAAESGDGTHSGLAPSSTFFTTPLSRPQTIGNPDPNSSVADGGRVQTAPPAGNIPFLSSLYGVNLDQVAYVALEVLGAGDSFGFRSVLPKEQRGSSVSLVSGGAEVIQINRKFFQKFADETVYSLVNMKFPPFPKQHDILKNLKQSFQWDDYKRRTIDDVLHRLYRPLVKP